MAGASTGNVDFIDQAVARVFAGEANKRRSFVKVVGTYFYNLGLLEERLGDIATASERYAVAERLENDEEQRLGIFACE